MKKLAVLMALCMGICSCNKDDGPTTPPEPELLKVIDHIEVRVTSGSNPTSRYITQFSYNGEKEISKIAYSLNDNLLYSYTYTYENHVPVSSMYDFPGGGDPVYEVNYGYVDGRYASYDDTYYDYSIAFSYDDQLLQYTNEESDNRYLLNEFDDITAKYLSNTGRDYAYTYDTTKKGPLYNVVSHRWLPIIWYGTSNNVTNELSIYPMTSIFENHLSQLNAFTNTYDTDGFVTTSEFSLNNGVHNYEIIYTYIQL